MTPEVSKPMQASLKHSNPPKLIKSKCKKKLQQLMSIDAKPSELLLKMLNYSLKKCNEDNSEINLIDFLSLIPGNGETPKIHFISDLENKEENKMNENHAKQREETLMSKINLKLAKNIIITQVAINAVEPMAVGDYTQLCENGQDEDLLMYVRGMKALMNAGNASCPQTCG